MIQEVYPKDRQSANTLAFCDVTQMYTHTKWHYMYMYIVYTCTCTCIVQHVYTVYIHVHCVQVQVVYVYSAHLNGHSSPLLHSPLTQKEQMCGRFLL